MSNVSLGGIVFIVDIDDINNEDKFYSNLSKISGFKESEGPLVDGAYVITFQVDAITEIDPIRQKIENVIEVSQ